MKLSEAYKRYHLEPITFACCTHCKLAWLDDFAGIGSLHCPKCGDVMLRGATAPDKYGCIEDVSPLETIRQIADEQPKDPGEQAKNIHPDAIPLKIEQPGGELLSNCGDCGQPVDKDNGIATLHVKRGEITLCTTCYRRQGNNVR